MSGLASISWHDLPVESFALESTGVRLRVTPYDEVTNKYFVVDLTLSEFDSFNLEMSGVSNASDLESIEISTFSFHELSPGYISGSMGLLPGTSGYWTLSFKKAKWLLSNA